MAGILKTFIRRLKRFLDFRNYNIKPKLIGFISIFILLAMITAVFFYFSLQNIQTANLSKNLILKITNYAQNIIYSEKEYLQNPTSYNMTQYSKNINEITVAFEELKKYYDQKDEIEFIMSLIKNNMNSFFSIAESFEDSKRKGYSDDVLLMLLNDAKNTLAEKR